MADTSSKAQHDHLIKLADQIPDGWTKVLVNQLMARIDALIRKLPRNPGLQTGEG